ncbi:ABC transporter permease subunit [Candidatus Lariskella endosymbiont of Hedychridium roseum]|uniref:ABC transporter permease n=1 Tax=Candidatus Lariskella endosymbiont of Hedychridium roseum TaxID=3077949 RepID=UPI0030D06FDC
MTLNEIIMSLEIGIIYGIVAIGIYLTFRIIDFPDLTCDGSFVLGAAVLSIMIKSGFDPWLSLIAAIFAGGVAGCITGILYTKFQVTNLLSGILVSFMLYSVNLRIMGGIPNITLINDATIFSESPIVALTIIILSICAIVTYLLMTDFGLALRSIGQNKRLAQNSGVKLMVIIGLVFSNAIIALGGALFSQHQGFADVGSGIGTVIVGLASVMIGERVMSSQSILVQTISCLIGSIIYRLFISFALYSDSLGLATADLNLLTGLMVIAIVYLSKRRAC